MTVYVFLKSKNVLFLDEIFKWSKIQIYDIAIIFTQAYGLMLHYDKYKNTDTFIIMNDFTFSKCKHRNIKKLKKI